MANLPLLRALGLNFSPNQLEVPAGSLVEASNVIIRRDNVIESRRGYSLYGEALGSSSDRCKQLITYKNKIVRHFSNQLQYEDGLNNSGVAAFFDFNEIVSGVSTQASVTEAQSGLKIKSIEANSNLYFTSSEGIRKISARSSDQFAAANIVPAGGIKALDVEAYLNSTLGDSTGFLPSDSGVAYKVVWGTKDANQNLILGTPSDSATILNPLLDSVLRDFCNLLLQLDNVTSFLPSASLLKDTDYFSSLALPISAESSQIKDNMVALTKKLDEDLLFANSSGTGAAYSQLGFAATASTTATLVSGNASITVASASGILPGMRAVGSGVFGTVVSVVGTTVTLSNKATVSNTLVPVNFYGIVASSGVINVFFSATSTPSNYFIAGDKIYVPTDTATSILGFTSNGISVENINGNQVVTVVSSDNIEFTARDYLTSNSVGISGTITNIPTVDAFSSDRVVLTSNGHGLKTGQIVTITGSNSSASIDGTYAITVLSNNTFSVDLGTQYTGLSFTAAISSPGIITCANHGFSDGTAIKFLGGSLPTGITAGTPYYVKYINTNTFNISTTPLLTTLVNFTTAGSGTVAKYIDAAGTAASWNIVIDGFSTAKIESYEFRSIAQPIDQSTPATNDELLSLQEYYTAIVTKLDSFITARSSNVVSSALYSAYLQALDSTTTATVTLKITIPPTVLEYTVDQNPYFYQIYRTNVSSASGVTNLNDIGIIQEYTQIDERYPTSGELSAGVITYLDNTPESIATVGAFLYTNERSGEGALQANDVPPYALDINSFKGYTFFSNTRTRQRKSLSMIGVAGMVSSYNPASPYKLTISDGSTTNTYTFILGVEEVSQLTCGVASSLASSGSASYFTLNSANNETEYYVWYKTGSSVDPAISGKTGISVSVNSTDTNAVVAQKTADALNNVPLDFSATVITNVVTIANNNVGIATDSGLGTLPVGFSIATTQQGQGENIGSKQILLSPNPSVGIAIEETTKSLIRVINRNPLEIVDGFYLSGTNTTPGSFLLEGRGLSVDEFYVLGSDSIIGGSFNPDLSPGTVTITGISLANPTVITTSANHNLLNGSKIIISNSNSTPSVDGVHQITWISSNSFSIQVNVTSAGSSAVFDSIENAEGSSNEEQKHRVYYSKYQQPEAVPILNYLDIGATDKAILRIFPLRDSLFVFKEDGLYRISGEVAPFTVALFDSSCILLAPDSVAVSNNQVYTWTTQGVSTVVESGVNIISRPIDTEILKKASSQFTNFRTATWGVGYESDNSYTVYTTNETTDEVPTIGFRYSNTTNSWTTVDKTCTAGIVNPADDKLYLGAGDVNFLEKERKEFTRYDYADRELSFELVTGSLSGKSIILPTVTNLSVGDVLVQEQTLSVYEFNALLKKLDLDPAVSDTNYFSTLGASAGDNLRTKLELLAAKLDGDVTPGYATLIATQSGSVSTASVANPTVITTSAPQNIQNGRKVAVSGVLDPSLALSEANGNYTATVVGSPPSSQFTIPVDLLLLGTGGSFITLDEDFEDLKVCFNLIVSRLNSDPLVSFSNYSSIDNNTTQEAIITAIDIPAKVITLNLSLDFIIGPITIYKAIPCRFTYTPITLGDPLGLKHMREATIMFANKAFTLAEMNFSTDLLPEIISVPFVGDGNGAFGLQPFGTGFFGGGSNSAPFRTYVPRQCQRCRFLNVGFVHQNAREEFAIYGITLTGEVGQSTRAYR